jgi:hypothetical protein
MRGEMDHTATIALIGFSLIVGTYLLSRLAGAMRVNRPKLPPLSEYRVGDCRLSNIINGGE